MPRHQNPALDRARKTLAGLRLLAEETERAAYACDFDPFRLQSELDRDPEYQRFRKLNQQAQFLKGVADDFESLFVRVQEVAA